jgi:hypothetical protein
VISPAVRATGALVCVFALGVLTGVAFERHSGERRAVVAVGAIADHEARMAELQEFLGLDEEQVRQIDDLMARRQATVQLMWERLRPEVQTAMQDVHAEITELLRPEQRALFHDWLTANRELSEEHRLH